jgi:hypothetical protein
LRKLNPLKIAKLFNLAALFLACGCGVKGDPVPPGTPPELGRGKPSYRRATEPLAFPVVPPPGERTEGDDDDKTGE